NGLGLSALADSFPGTVGSAALFALALLVVAGMVKAAQPPFTGWLLGAMVAPTPVSALLHSSTMVKAGVYLVLRLSPAFAPTPLGPVVAVLGGFGFLSGALLAMGRSDGKEVLAYSTISNLGLIVACAGIGTGWAIAAGTLLLVFHALAKGLLFLCVGSADQALGGRRAEDLDGMAGRMPRTAALLALGVAAMLLPPFGMLLGKWMAVEAASNSVLLLLLLALGSGLTVAYWARWAGLTLAAAPGPMATTDAALTPQKRERLPQERERLPEESERLRLGPEAALAGLTLLGALLSPWLYALLAPAGADVSGLRVGGFVVLPLVLAAGAGGWLAWRGWGSTRTDRRVGAYLAGLPPAGSGASYEGPLGGVVRTGAGLYAFEHLFGETLLLPWINRAAIVLLALLLSLGAFAASGGGL
ncbi:MAG: proton-conducting transporter membrane subunit, partial [Desulfovibrionaceae bacterium]